MNAPGLAPAIAERLRQRGHPEDVELLTRTQVLAAPVEDVPYFELWVGGEPLYYRLPAQEAARRAEWEAQVAAGIVPGYRPAN